MSVQKISGISCIVLAVVLVTAFAAVAQTTEPVATKPDSEAAKSESLGSKSPIIRQIVPQMATAIGDEEINYIRDLVVKLGSDDAEVSKKAGVELKGSIALAFQMFDDHYLSPREFGMESIKRLEGALGGDDAFRELEIAMGVVKNKGLLDDPSYLVGLLDETNARYKKSLAARLQKITGQKLGDDVVAWKKWLKANPDFSYGPFEEYAEQIADIAPLKLVGKNLALDRQRWTGVTKATDITKFPEYQRKGEKYFRKRSLAQFSKENGYAGDYGIPLLNLNTAGRRTGKTLNRPGKEVVVIDIRIRSFTCAFRPVRKNFDITFSEFAGRERQLRVVTGEGILYLLMTDDEDKFVMLLDQKADGKFHFIFIDKSGTVCITEDSFMDFWTKYGNGAGKKAGEILRYLWVKLPEPNKKPAAVAKKAPEAPKGEGRQLWQDGLFNNSAMHITMLLALKNGESGISLDTNHWARQKKADNGEDVDELRNSIHNWPWETAMTRLAQSAMDRLRKNIQPNQSGGSGSSAGMGNYRTYFNKDNLRAELYIRDNRGISISLRELDVPYREITVNDDSSGRFNLEIRNRTNDLFIRLDQYPGGRFSVMEIRGDVIFGAVASSFEEFYRKHGDYVSKRLFPYLNYLGVATPEVKAPKPAAATK